MKKGGICLMCCDNCVKVIIFFKVLIDNLSKMIYNVKRLLCNLMQKRQKMVHFMILLMLLPLFSVFSVCSESDERKLSLFLEANFSEESEIVSVFLKKTEGDELCGLTAELVYDPELFSFVSAEKSEFLRRSAEFDYEIAEKGIRFIIDDVENISGSELAVFYFTAKSRNFCDASAFSLSCISDMNACRIAGDKIIPIKVDLSETVLLDSCRNDGKVSIASLDGLNKNDEEISVSFVGIASGEYFAAGFEISAVALSTSQKESFCAVGVLPLSVESRHYYEQIVSFPSSGVYCVTVRPIAYGAKSWALGDETIFLVVNGKVCK